MSEIRPDWQDAVRRGLFGKAEFSEEMKRSVLEAVDRRHAMRFRPRLHLIGIAALCVIAGIVLFYNADDAPWTADAGKQAGVGEPVPPSGDDQIVQEHEWGLPVTFRYLEARKLQKGEVISENDDDILPGLSNKHSPLWGFGQTIELSFDEIEILDQRPVDGLGSAIRFTKLQESNTKHGTDEKYDYIGFVIDGVSKPNTLLHFGYGHLYDNEIMMARLFGKNVVKIAINPCRTDGDSCTYYLHQSNGSIIPYAIFEAETYEYDLDGDGREEAIVTTYKQNQIYVFKEENGELLWASIRDVLGAKYGDIIDYNREQGWFSIRSKNSGAGEPVRTYRYDPGTHGLIQLQS
ncbi:hypothetical protein D3P09_22920 [Paenibacillus pinisoli]|uniref:Uncharacterized protein n=1 Tax=Paenibacillus pinisoli TaxID=1276110 RepID=A0A3A6PBY9_9BACL|nr:hypothetical protein [Paenibacillus pinisoli]RJX37216.1 hypothetical protein D3P09_22920 [Paenibacillus pinisoli]